MAGIKAISALPMNIVKICIEKFFKIKMQIHFLMIEATSQINRLL